MDEIRPWLYIGNYKDSLDQTQIERKSIRSMLLFASPVQIDGINSLYLSIEDSYPVPQDMIRKGISFTLEEKQKGHTLLVSCGAGISRSTAFCVAALKETEKLSLLNAYSEVRIKHPEGLPNKAVWESFCEYYQEPASYLDVMRTYANIKFKK